MKKMTLDEAKTIVATCAELNQKWGAVPNDYRHWRQELIQSLSGVADGEREVE